MDVLKLKHVPIFRDNHLEPAINEGLIELTIPDKPRSSNQKYRLTKKGKALKKELQKSSKKTKQRHVKENMTDYVTDYDEIGISELSSKLLSVLSGDMSRQDIMDSLGLKNAASFRDNYINPGLADELIATTIPDKPKSKDQKYRLTILGEKLKRLI